MCGGTGAVACLWRTGSDFQDSVLTFHHMGSEDRTQGVKLGGKHLSPLKHLQTPTAVVFFGFFFFLFACLLLSVPCYGNMGSLSQERDKEGLTQSLTAKEGLSQAELEPGF